MSERMWWMAIMGLAVMSLAACSDGDTGGADAGGSGYDIPPLDSAALDAADAGGDAAADVAADTSDVIADDGDAGDGDAGDGDVGPDDSDAGDAAEDGAVDSSKADDAADAEDGADVAVDSVPSDMVADTGVDTVADTGVDTELDTSVDAATDASVDADADTEPADVAADSADAASDAADAGDGASDGGAPVWGPATPLGCKKFVNKNLDGTVNPFISPARDGQFYVSWVQKGGDLMLAWESPKSCATVEGPLQVNKTKGDVYYWGGIGVVSDKAGNFYAVWESQTKGAEISLAWSTSGKDFGPPIEVVSTSTNGQDPALYVASPGVVHAAWRGHHATKPQYDPYYAKATDLFNAKTFSPGVLVHDDAPQDDQVAIAVDSKGNLFLAWQSFDGDIFISRSTDGGKVWSPAVQVNDVKGKANVGKASFLTITPDDRVVLMWSDERKAKSGNENDVFADSSVDGLVWGADVQVNDNDARYQEDPSMVVATGAGCAGAIYAVWQDFRNKKSYDIVGARSVDGGKTWSANVVIAGDVEGDEMNPAIAVDRTCVVGVAWRDSTKNDSFDIGTTYLTW